jgi:two-component system response regulator HydG
MSASQSVTRTARDAGRNTILIVDDDQDAGDLVCDVLSKRGFRVELAQSGEAALEATSAHDVDVVLSDIKLGGMNGLELCERLATSRPDVPVVVMTAFGNLENAVGAVRVGAYDFITKPLNGDVVAHAIRRAIDHRELNIEVRRLRAAVDCGRRMEELLGDSAPMRLVFEVIEQVAPTDASVLITGESGTGKDLVARAIHARSARGEGPFVAINCAAMPPALLESELFGHEKGAFTDAKQRRAGLFLQASGGTLFLDEISEMPAEMQAKHLRALQEHKVRPVGGDAEVSFDARIISATNRDLESEVEENRFRADLFYRINVVHVPVPPLRARQRDILILAQHFLEQCAGRYKKDVVGIEEAAARKLLDFDWPGNVRELENCMERAVALTKMSHVTASDLPEKIRDYQPSRIIIGGEGPDELITLEEMERRYVRRVLDACGGNKTQAAKVLGVDRRSLYRRLERIDGHKRRE